MRRPELDAYSSDIVDMALRFKENTYEYHYS